MDQCGKLFGVMILGLCFLLWPQAGRTQGSLGWQVTAFAGQSVTLVQANENNPNQIAAVASNNLYLSNDGGVIWSQSSVPYMVRAISYDPVRPGRIYAATDRGVFWSDNLGLSWRSLNTETATQKIGITIISNGEHIFVAMYDGIGTPVKLYRFNELGGYTTLPFPDAGATSLAYRATDSMLYVGSQNGVWYSQNKGDNWTQTAPGAGRFTYKIIVKRTTLVQISADGLYRSDSSGQHWNRLAGPGDINGTYYGNDMRMTGLAMIGDNIVYGAWSYGYPYKFLTLYFGGAAKSEFEARVYDVVAAGDRAWVASDRGLWASRPTPQVEPTVSRPLIIVPGILGSWQVPSGMERFVESYLPEPTGADYHTSFVLDPITGSYNRFIKYLETVGYRPGQTLFSFPYDWRQDNQQSGRQLAQRIMDVRRVCGCGRVDIVTHSMGGLVARSYIQSSLYRDDVQNLIMAGTPNQGSLDIYKIWEAGDLGPTNSLMDYAKYATFRVEAFQNGYLSLASYIRNRVPAVGQLLPVFSYIQGRQYPVGYPRNEFLEKLNLIAARMLLQQRVSLHLVGSDSHQTASSFEATEERPDQVAWPHGKVLSTQTAKGDGTVLLSSLNLLGSVSRFVPDNHSQMFGGESLQQFVTATLLGSWKYPVSAMTAPTRPGLVIMAKSASQLIIRDDQGRRLSDNHYDIPGAYYTGSQAVAQFAMLPLAGSSAYTIEAVNSTGSGYVIEVWDTVRDPEAQDIETVSTVATTTSSPQAYQYDTVSRQLTSISAPLGSGGVVLSAKSIDSMDSTITDVGGRLVALSKKLNQPQSLSMSPTPSHNPSTVAAQKKLAAWLFEYGAWIVIVTIASLVGYVALRGLLKRL